LEMWVGDIAFFKPVSTFSLFASSPTSTLTSMPVAPSPPGLASKGLTRARAFSLSLLPSPSPPLSWLCVLKADVSVAATESASSCAHGSEPCMVCVCACIYDIYIRIQQSYICTHVRMYIQIVNVAAAE